MSSIRDNPDLLFSVTTAGSDKPEGKLIKLPGLKQYPNR